MKLITTFKTDVNAPVTGLTPLISITDVTNTSFIVLVADEANMTELSFGFYSYEFSSYVAGHQYTIYIDAVSDMDYRYQYGTIGTDVSIIREAVWDDLLTSSTHDIDNSSGKLIRQSNVTTGLIYSLVTLVKKAFWNKKTLTGNTQSYVEVVYDDDSTTPIRTQTITRTGINTQVREPNE
jgi:hypothetical protein